MAFGSPEQALLGLVDDERFGPGDDSVLAMIDVVLDKLRSEGAEVIDVTSVDPTLCDAAGRIPGEDEFMVLLFEFRCRSPITWLRCVIPRCGRWPI